MKTNFTKAAMVVTVLLFSQAYSQNSDEAQLRSLNTAYPAAVLSNDVTYFENLLAPDYVSFNSGGTTENRDAVLKWMKEEKNKPSYKIHSMTSDNDTYNISGNQAYVTGKWKMTSSGLEPGSAPHGDEGHYISLYEKRNGKWLMTREYVTEKAHSKEELEPLLKQASEAYDKALGNKDAAALKKLLADDYLSTNPEGKTRNKTEEIAMMTSADLVINSGKAEDKKFRIYRNTGIETGRFNVNGTYKGKAFNETGRYTSTWIFEHGVWKMVSDHTSQIK